MIDFHGIKPKGTRLRNIFKWGGSVAVFGALLFATLAPTPFLVEQPGPTYNLLSTIGGQPVISIPSEQTFPVSGDLSMLTVTLKGGSERGASWIDLGLTQLDPAQSIIDITDIYPAGWDDAKLNAQSDLMMLDSQANAKAAALRLLEIPYISEIKITVVDKTGAAGGILKAGDTLLRVDGEVATGLEQVRGFVAASKGERAVRMEIMRDGEKLSLSVTPRLVEKQWRLGIYVQTVPTFPFEIDVQVGNVGGPSAGQMLVLAIYDKLTPGKLTGGKRIAGTGTISPEGKIGPIGGVKQKMYGAKRAGHNWFLVPNENCGEVIGNIPDGLNVISVTTIQDSLTAVEAIASNADTSQLQRCTK